jgi:hypothetical protein
VAMVCWSRFGLLADVFVETRVAARSDALSDVLIASMPSLMLATSWSICLKEEIEAQQVCCMFGFFSICGLPKSAGPEFALLLLPPLFFALCAF